MNQFRLFAHGAEFDVDAFLARTALPVSSVWRRGEQRRYSCIESRHPTSGLEVVLGDGQSLPVFDQERIAIEYLIANRDELRALAQFPGAATFLLGLQYVCQLHDNLLGFCIGPSALLMWHSLDIGVVPTYHIDLVRTKESESETDPQIED